MSASEALRLLRRVTGLVFVSSVLLANAAIAYPEAEELAALIMTSGQFEFTMETATKTASRTVLTALEAHLQRQISNVEVVQVNRAIDETFKEILPAATWKAFYARMFTEHVPRADARDLLRFYKTPLGAKALRLSLVLSREGAKGGEELALKHADEFGRRFNELVAQRLPELKREIESRPKR